MTCDHDTSINTKYFKIQTIIVKMRPYLLCLNLRFVALPMILPRIVSRSYDSQRPEGPEVVASSQSWLENWHYFPLLSMVAREIAHALICYLFLQINSVSNHQLPYIA